MNQNTTLGKTLKTLAYAGGSAALIAVLSLVTSKPELFNPTLVVVANLVLVFVKNFLDKNTPNI